MTVLELNADVREKLGSATSRNLLRSGKVPAIVYGPGHDNLAIAVEAKAMDKLFKSGFLTSTVIELKLANNNYKALVKHVQLDPVKDTVKHVDFTFVNPQSMTAAIPVKFEGQERSIGVKRGGFFNIIHRKIKINCANGQLPQSIVVDATQMKVGEKLLAGQIELPAGCSLAMPDTAIVANIIGKGKSAAEEKAE